MTSRQREFFSITRQAAGSLSMNVTWAAPRDNASKPIAPVPAKTSRKIAFCGSVSPTFGRAPCCKMSNNASRTRSDVGRIARPRGFASCLPRNLPPIIRSAYSLCAVRRLRPAKLFFNDLAGHFSNVTWFELAKLERPEGGSDQPVDLESHMFHQTTNFSVLTL